MEYILSAEQMRSADAHAISEIGIPSAVLMERAALAVAGELKKAGFSLSDLLIVCGSGNNGGDGFALARLLKEEGYTPTLAFVGKDESMTEDCALQRRICEKLGLNPDPAFMERSYATIVDAIFGTGLSRPVGGSYKEVVDWINSRNARVVSVDIPSGISADSGQILGCAVRADLTVTMAAKKIGQLLSPGLSCCGKLICRRIGVPVEDEKALRSCTREDLALLPERRPDSNKGSYGKVLLIAGSEGMSGAAILSARAALRAGCGMVRVFTPECNREILQMSLPEALVSCYDPAHFEPELLRKALNWSTVVGIGPGLGQSENAAALLETLLKENSNPLVIDADGLNLLSNHPSLMELLPENAILTPHVGEMARLCGLQPAKIKEDPFSAAKDFAKKHKCILVLKDARTVISDGERLQLNLSGNNGMATAGSGDVLTGVICSLLAQGLSPYPAAYLGVYVHGLAGDLARKKRGSYGMLSGEIADCVGDVMAEAKGE